MQLADGSRIAVVGGGPAGSLTAYFLLETAGRLGLSLAIDLFEPKDFSRFGPPGCNHCGGIVSETLVQMLAAEGIILPEAVVQRGIDAYVLHSGQETVRIDTPGHEKRIAAVYRGAGPLGAKDPDWQSFDGHLLSLAEARGASIVKARVEGIARESGLFVLTAGGADHGPYEFLVGAGGLDAKTQALFACLGFGYTPPDTAKAAIAEIELGEEAVKTLFGDAMHVFLQDIPGLEFAAVIPKRRYVTICLLGDIDKDVLSAFFGSEEVRGLFPPEVDLERAACGCRPFLNLGLDCKPYADRLALLGDMGVSRLYKDGIGAAYRSSKALAVAAIFDGVSAKALSKRFGKATAKLAFDNRVGELCFLGVSVIKRFAVLRRAVMALTAREQARPDAKRAMSLMLWDLFTGSAPYRDVFWRPFSPVFLLRLAGAVMAAVAGRKSAS